MSLVHEKLYQSQNLSKLNLKDYLNDLIDNIMSEYGVTQEKIMIINQMEDIDVLIDTGVPCGLVINELVSNVVKHAFPGEQKGEMLVKLSVDNAGGIELIISDNGVGTGADFELKDKESMGLQIIRNIIEYQLKGTIEIDNSSGMKWVIKFNDNLYEERI